MPPVNCWLLLNRLVLALLHDLLYSNSTGVAASTSGLRIELRPCWRQLRALTCAREWRHMPPLLDNAHGPEVKALACESVNGEHGAATKPGQ